MLNVIKRMLHNNDNQWVGLVRLSGWHPDESSLSCSKEDNGEILSQIMQSKWESKNMLLNNVLVHNHINFV